MQNDNDKISEDEAAAEEEQPQEAVVEERPESLAARARRAFGFGEGKGDTKRDVESEAMDNVDEREIRAEADGDQNTLLEAARAEARENYDKYLRAAAELENFRKRTAKERADLLRYAGEHIAFDILEVVDILERALAQDATVNPEEVRKGIELTYDRFLAILEKHGIKPADALGKTFDPTHQEALASVPTAEHSPNTVIEQFRKAYFFKDKLLRPGQVVVAVAPAEEASAEQEPQAEQEEPPTEETALPEEQGE